MLVLWTDGSAEPNPGPGGWAVIDASSKQPLLTGSEEHTTNIRMEGTALKEAMKYAISRQESLELHTDSEFWVNVLTKWAPTWEHNGWKKKSGEIKNLELVQELYRLYQTGNIKLIWVKGHAGIELNELADEAATSARLQQ